MSLCKQLSEDFEHKTHCDGHFYQKPAKFPCVLHDRNGCVLLSRIKFDELVKSRYINVSKGVKINIKHPGISNIEGYSRCPMSATCPKYKGR